MTDYASLNPGCESLSRRLSLPVLDEGLCRNAQALVQPPDHFQRQRALARQHFINAIAAADERDQIGRLKPRCSM